MKGQRNIEGKDYAIGDRLPSIFLQAGLHGITAEVQADPWLMCDTRRKLEDVKDEIRFELQTFRKTNMLERKMMLAGGAKSGEITTLVRKFERRMKQLLSDDEKLRASAVFYVGGLYLVTGRRI